MSLPIDEHLGRIVAAVEARGAVVLVAEPGAGKTTRVPPALLGGGGQVLVLEPRRVAARLAAKRVAEERGEALGDTVGYQVRFEARTSAATRLTFVTEGILERRLQRNPTLAGVGTVVLDELHERSLHTDLALALLARLHQTARPDLRLVAMSATLDAEPVAAFLDAEVIRVPGRLFPVELEYLPDAGRRDVPLPRRVAGALSRLLDRWPEGDVLVFLPGIGDIRRCQESLGELARARELDVCPLHGSLSLDEQARALAPGVRRKIILSTNVAESSLTVEGVTAVLDSGLARTAIVLPGAGLPALITAPISKAAADQRAGRAGRLRPGLCVRLYSEADYHGRHAHEAPELQRSELAEPLLAAAAAGWNLRELDWLEPPPPAALAAAERLLLRLGAITPAGHITAIGRQTARLPLPVRLARFVVEAASLGAPEAACHLAALVSEGDLPGQQVLDPVIAAVAPGRGHGRSGSRVARTRQQLLRLMDSCGRREGEAPAEPRASRRARREGEEPQARAGESSSAPKTRLGESLPIPERLRFALLAGHPDRVAQRRSPGQLTMAGGGSARLADGGHALEGRYFLVLAAHGSGHAAAGAPREAMVTAATPIDTDWLLDLHADWIEERQLVSWNVEAERVESREQLTYGKLILEESVNHRPRGPAVSQLLCEQALAAGLAAFADADEVESFLARLAFASSLDPALPAPAEDATHTALELLCRDRSSFAALRRADLLAELRTSIETTSPGATARLQALAPEHVTLAGGRRLKVTYEPTRPPWVQSMLQDFFGQTQGPSVGGGRVPVVLHLLAPNRRPLQITTDLAGFWERHYPTIRRQLRQRYTRHDWPEDPLTATPPAPRKGRPRPRR